jgi:hypothetical protein
MIGQLLENAVIMGVKGLSAKVASIALGYYVVAASC